MVKPLIAIIEDEEDLLELLEFHLKKADFEVEGFLNVQNIEKLLKEEPVDLLLVDRNLPGVEGAEFIKRLREKGYATPVIFLTAKSGDKEKLEGFEAGADDYITKPFKFEELIARIRAVLKRTKGEEQEVYQYRDLILKPKSRELFVDGESVELTKLEFYLLLEFIKNRHIVLSREYLLETVWGACGEYQDKTVNVAIKRLREKIDPDKEKNYFRSVRGEGYTLC